MASEEAGQGGRILATVLRSLKIFLVNSCRRSLMLSHYAIICFHHLRLRRIWRVLGKRVHLSVEGGEVNPMLAGVVKDSLAKAQALQARRNRHSQAAAALREKIRAGRAQAPTPPEAESAPAGEPGPDRSQS
jgi:hypothetical protein